MSKFWIGLSLGFIWGLATPDLCVWLMPGVVP